jgi:hypothetical protein
MGRLNESRTSAVLDDALAVRAVRALAPEAHAQHAITLLIGLDGDVAVNAAVRGRAVLVAADVTHRATAAGPVLELAYDPEAIRTIAVEGVRVVDGAMRTRIAGAVAAHRASITRPDVLGGLAREIGRCLAIAPPRRLDRRVAAVVEALRDPDTEARPPRISAAHLRALFVRDVGIPIRTYALWRRALVAMGAFNRVDATTAAHGAGFADLAHFSRTCRRMFGAPPTALGRALL